MEEDIITKEEFQFKQKQEKKIVRVYCLVLGCGVTGYGNLNLIELNKERYFGHSINVPVVLEWFYHHLGAIPTTLLMLIIGLF